MRKNCLNCMNISSYGMGEVNCAKKGRIRAEDPFEYVRKDIDCEYFDPEIVNLNYKGAEREKYLAIVEKFKNSPLIGDSVKRFLQIPSDTHMWTGRGMAMIELSDDNLSSFEGDSEFKNYGGSNHRFADLLVPESSRVKKPVIFWLAKKNPVGARYLIETKPIIHHVIQLGNPYSLEEILFCLARALKFEGVYLVVPWFVRDIEHTIQKKINEIDPICEEVYFEIESSIKRLLITKADELQVGTINWFIYRERPPDLEIASKVMALGDCYICRTDARKTVLYRKTGDEREKECSFSEFIAKDMSPLSLWLLFDIDDTYWGSQWITAR